MKKTSRAIAAGYRLAVERYAAVGVDVEAALRLLEALPVSIHCWQGDDVGGFEEGQGSLGDGLAVTGSHPGRAGSVAELREHLEVAYSLIPGRHRLNLHAIYGEFGGRRVDRDEIGPEHFRGWIAWAKDAGVGLDFNPTFFSHAKSAEGFTLSHRDAGIRRFWIEHGRRCREIGAAMGRAQGGPCVTNVWIPDGYKDTPVDRAGPRERLVASLDAVFEKRFPAGVLLDAVEPKLFGIGCESYVAGSHEFYLGYAITRKKLLCLDAGHFHPTEGIADKISSVLQYVPSLLLHVSRGVRWDSDHVVVLNDDLLAIAREIVWPGRAGRIHVGLDYFDASINRIAAWVIGARNLLRALLVALLEPHRGLVAAEVAGDYTSRLAWQEEARGLPWGAVWDYYCESKDVPVGGAWLDVIGRRDTSVGGTWL